MSLSITESKALVECNSMPKINEMFDKWKFLSAKEIYLSFGNCPFTESKYMNETR